MPRPVRVVISDRHIGTTMWQHAMLRRIGVDAIPHTISKHVAYAPAGFLRGSYLLKKLHHFGPYVARFLLLFDREIRQASHLLCSFPPSRFLQLAKLPERMTIVVNVGHRIHVHLDEHDLIDFTETFAALAQSDRFELAVMSEYDFHYTRFYTGIEDLRRLPVVSHHLPAELRERAYRPQNNVVLVGPSHNVDRVPFFDDIHGLNRESANHARRRGVTPLEFRFIKDVYPENTATPDNLARHPAVLMVPYSAFSVSMVELYQLNLPFFVPADGVPNGEMEDVRLSPLYHAPSDIQRLEDAYESRGLALGYSYSPNDSSTEATRYWMQFMYFNQVANAVRFETAHELFEKIYGLDFAALNQRMLIENAALFREQEAAWRDLLGQD